ncbi:MAG: fatty acid desaturase [Pseudomonadales bacterium]|nr:fatty acid desaturase [Pseudomonadales bacterium]
MDPVFRYSADRLPVTLILSLTLLDFIMYFTASNVWVLLSYFVLTLIPKGCICAWNHHHQHTKTFNWTPLNRLLEMSFSLHTGVTTNQWLLHHVFGHHHNYLDQEKDESRWQRNDGSTMGELEYTIKVAATAYPRAWGVGKRYPRHLRTHLIYTALTLILAVALVVYQPLQGFILFIMPMLAGLLITAWATYDHHAGLPTEDDFTSSYNVMNKAYNVMTGNLGYHTAHHYKQGVHWSELPKLHDEIKHLIPEELYRRSYWDYVTDVPMNFIRTLVALVVPRPQ